MNLKILKKKNLLFFVITIFRIFDYHVVRKCGLKYFKHDANVVSIMHGLKLVVCSFS